MCNTFTMHTWLLHKVFSIVYILNVVYSVCTYIVLRNYIKQVWSDHYLLCQITSIPQNSFACAAKIDCTWQQFLLLVGYYLCKHVLYGHAIPLCCFLQDASAQTVGGEAMEVLPEVSPIAPVKSAHALDVAEPGDSIGMYIVLCVNVSVNANLAALCHY